MAKKIRVTFNNSTLIFFSKSILLLYWNLTLKLHFERNKSFSTGQFLLFPVNLRQLIFSGAYSFLSEL